MTFFFLKARNPTVHSSYSDGKSSENISVVVEIDDELELEIGEKSLAISKKRFNRYKDKKNAVELALAISKASEYKSVVAKFATRGDKEKAVGYAKFWEEHYSESMYETSPAALYFNVYVSDEMYERIYSNIANKLSITHVRLEGEAAEGEIKFGSAMDGSQQIWQPKLMPHKLDLYDFNISFAQTEEVDIEVVNEQQEKKNVLIEKLFKDINAMQFALYVIAAAAAMEIVKRVIG